MMMSELQKIRKRDQATKDWPDINNIATKSSLQACIDPFGVEPTSVLGSRNILDSASSKSRLSILYLIVDEHAKQL